MRMIKVSERKGSTDTKVNTIDDQYPCTNRSRQRQRRCKEIHCSRPVLHRQTSHSGSGVISCRTTKAREGKRKLREYHTVCSWTQEYDAHRSCLCRLSNERKVHWIAGSKFSGLERHLLRTRWTLAPAETGVGCRIRARHRGIQERRLGGAVIGRADDSDGLLLNLLRDRDHEELLLVGSVRREYRIVRNSVGQRYHCP